MHFLHAITFCFYFHFLPLGYRGRVCEHPSNLCDSGPCKNGGSCNGNHTIYTCSCTNGWGGPQCTQLASTLLAAPPGVETRQQEDRYYLKMQPHYSQSNSDHYFQNTNAGTQNQNSFITTDSTNQQHSQQQQSSIDNLELSGNGAILPGEEASFQSSTENENCESGPCVHGVCIDTPTQTFRCFCQPGIYRYIN